MKTEKLKTVVKKGAEITEEELNQMYEIRAYFMRLKPSVRKEDDFSFFEKMVRRANKVYHFVDSKNQIKGSYVYYQHEEYSENNRRKRIVVEPEFGFVLDAYHGKYIPQTVRYNTLKYLFRYPFTLKYMIGPYYPNSFLSLLKHSPEVWALGDPEIPQEFRDIIIGFAERHQLIENGKFNGVKNLNTVPRRMTTESELKRLESHPCYARYKQQNPNWAEGYGLIVVCKINFRALGHQLAMTFKKRRKRPLG